MKKRISLLLCALIMVLSFVGCSGKEDAGSKYDQATLEQSAEFIVSNFSQMGEADFAQFKEYSEFQLNAVLMNSGLKISGEAFVGMISSWEAAEEECGKYVSHGDYELEVKSDGVMISTLAQYEEREAVISFSFDEKSYMKSMDVSAKFSMGEILSKAGLNTLLGMGTVFAVLIFLALIISTLKYIPMLLDKSAKKSSETVTDTKEVVEETVCVDESDDLELIAVITAAIAAQEGTSTDGFVVRSIRRRPSNNWN